MSGQEESLTLDLAKDFFYTQMRACERHANVLKNFIEVLDGKKEGDPWLEEIQLEASKGRLFHEQQHHDWEGFDDRVKEYIESIRQLADEIALQELSTDDDEVAKAKLKENSTKFVHPELHKFKLEKQARILGKIGGVPAFGGMAMGRIPRELILKASGGAAAREVHYSKMENKDARYLADVIQFKQRKSEDGPQLSQWQEESKNLRAKAQAEATKDEAPQMMFNTPYTSELTGKLKARQDALKQEEEESSKKKQLEKAHEKATVVSAELASMFNRRQALMKRKEEEEAEEANPTAPSTDWCNAAAPFGSELGSVLQQRQQKKLEEEAAAKVAPKPLPPPSTAGASSELAALLKKRQQATEET